MEQDDLSRLWARLWQNWRFRPIFVIGLVLAAIGALKLIGLGPTPVPAPAQIPSDYATPAALQELQQAADTGDADAQFLLASLYRDGDGVASDPAKAFELAVKSAGQGNANGEWLLGVLYKNGEGTESNMELAAQNFEAAAEQGDPWSQAMLGGFYMNGTGVTQDKANAYKWLSLAASQGNAAAKSFLSVVKDTFTPEEIDEGARGAQSIREKIGSLDEE